MVLGLALSSLVVGSSFAAAGHLKSQKDQASYAIGYEIGKSFADHQANLNPSALSQAVQDAMTGKKPALSETKMKAAMQAFRQQSMKKMEGQMTEVADKNKKAGEAFLAANKTKADVVTLDSGLQYKILQKGTGPKPAASDTVTVDYEGSLTNGQVFDSSYKRGQPATFPVGGVIKGWQDVLQLMPAGSTWEVYIPSDLAYGERGAPGAIGPNETLVFKIHLIKIDK